MQTIHFPLFKTKTEEISAKNMPQKFDLTDAEQRQKYFILKAGKEIKRLRNYLEKNTFVAYLLGKKNSGKGTYAKMFKEIVAPEKIEHFSVGDIVRELDDLVKNKEEKEKLLKFLEKNYRGYLSLDEIIRALEERSTQTLLPSELILALVKKKIAESPKKALFIDGFPRNLDQISYSLFFRDLIGYRDDPDVFILIDVPESVIDERMRHRVVCPLCQTSRNIKLLPTKQIGYDQNKKQFYLICDNPYCKGKRMVGKEGDELGIELIKERLRADGELIKKAFLIYGVPKILLRNSVPIEKANELVEDYEITPEYTYEFQNGMIRTIEKPWHILDDEGIPSYSLLPPPVVVSLIKQLTEAINA